MLKFFSQQPPQTPGEAFLRGFKYVNQEGKRNSTPFYNLIKHNDELSEYILNKANNIITLCNSLINSEDAVNNFLEQINDIIKNVLEERIRLGKAELKNVHKQALLHEDEAGIIPIKTADIYRKPYKIGQFEKYLINGLTELKKFIIKNYGSNDLLIERCNMCIADIHNYRSQAECISYGFEIFQNTNIPEQTAEIAKEYPVNVLSSFSPK